MVKILMHASTASLILVTPATNCTFPSKSFVWPEKYLTFQSQNTANQSWHRASINKLVRPKEQSMFTFPRGLQEQLQLQ